MKDWIVVLELIIALLLMLVILLQNKGSGLGTAFGSSGGTFSTRRGAEKVLYQATVLLAALFVLIPIANLLFFR